MQHTTSPRWQFWIDRGGTFTDVVARRPDGTLVTHKLLSDNPEQYPDAAVHGVRQLLGLAPGEPITPALVDCVKMGTTVATNALLERKGDPTLLVITQGFRDALRIAYQNRPRLFDRHIVLPELLYSRVVEARERLSAQGEVVQALDEAQLLHDLQAAFDAGLRAVAIVFMHGYRHVQHEQAAAALARRVGFTQVSVSHEVSPLMKLVGRGDTTVVDAYLSPILRRYVQQVAAQMPGVPLYFMQSSGGLTHAQRFQGKDAILSGPAGGIVGMARTAQVGLAAVAPGEPVRVIGFDMGGTSTDVSHFAGEFERAFETQVAGVRMRAPMMSIHTVAAGGGSLLTFDGARLRVGPQSAGANPGPACYRRGGPLAVTDANVMLGKIAPQHFPKVFGPRGDEALDADVVRERFTQLARDIAAATGLPRSPEDVAEGYIDIAVGGMANAIKKISVARGYDVTRYTLQCFGGAGGQHACRVADALGMTRVFVHPLAGVLSAYGMGLADQIVIREHAVERRLGDDAVAEVQALIDRLSSDAAAQLAAQGVSADRITLKRRAHVRYEGSDTAIPVEYGSAAQVKNSFEAAYKQQYSFLMEGRALVIEAVSVEAIGAGEAPAEQAYALGAPREAPACERVRMYTGGRWHDAKLYEKHALRPGDVMPGPAIVAERNATTVVEPGWQARVTTHEHLLIERVQPREQAFAAGTHADPVLLEVFNNLFMNIAEQMGLQLQNTAHSVNIKERLDFSCALFDGDGNLIANAPHMPVHLGSMSESIKTVIARNADTMRPGNAYVLNDPYHGGTHLPDITVITPVYLDEDAAAPNAPAQQRGGQESSSMHAPQAELTGENSPTLSRISGGGQGGGTSGGATARPAFYVGSRGHHADVGGITPGSMPPFSTRVEEEGVQLDNVLLVEQGRLREREMLDLLGGTATTPWPSRNPQQNLADLKAQIAANEKGVQELRKMVAQFGLDVVQAYMRHVQDNAEESVRRVITALYRQPQAPAEAGGSAPEAHGRAGDGAAPGPDGQFTLPLDNGAKISVAIRVDRNTRSAVIDFTGTSPQLPNNFNAPRAVCMAAVLYVFRTLVNDDIPLNAGCLKPLHVIIPPGSMLDPQPPASVVAGNVETSTCITNALYGALGVMAASQCTMNNFTFGNARHQYYETVSGGSGAGAVLDAAGRVVGGFDGTSVVQTHMTNSRLTDPEVLEFRYPVRLESYEIRHGSGGAGRWHGGDGGVRKLRFLEPMTASILSNGRVHPAFGMAGGAPGALGHNIVQRHDGTREELPHIGSTAMQPGDVFIIETPGGGGFGKP